MLVDKQSIRNIKVMTREALVDCQHDLGVFVQKNRLYSEESPLIKHLGQLGIAHFHQDTLASHNRSLLGASEWGAVR